MNVSLKINLDGIIDEVDDLFKKQIPYAAFLALNESMFKATAKVRETVPYFIQGGPVPFTKRGFQYTKAKNKYDLKAKIFIPDEQWKYMRWVVDGGVETFNKSRHGGAKPIYKNVRFNKYGNIAGRKNKEPLWRDLLNGNSGPQLRALGKNEFVGTVNGTTGVWKRYGAGGRTGLKLMILIDHKPVNYKGGRFPFFKFASKYGNKYFSKAFNRKLVSIVKRESRKLKAT